MGLFDQGRSTRSIAGRSDLWQIVESWASAHKMQLHQDGGRERCYISAAPKLAANYTDATVVVIRDGGLSIKLEAYGAPRGTPVTPLGLAAKLQPKEYPIDATSFFGGDAGRKPHRKIVNALLAELGSEPL